MTCWLFILILIASGPDLYKRSVPDMPLCLSAMDAVFMLAEPSIVGASCECLYPKDYT